VAKKVSQTVEEVKREHPEARVEAWAENEHSSRLRIYLLFNLDRKIPCLRHRTEKHLLSDS
jgi:hypothetical protein